MAPRYDLWDQRPKSDSVETNSAVLPLFVLIGLTLYIHMLNNVIQEIDEEIEDVRIPKGEIKQADWDAFDLKIRRENE